MTTPPPGLVTCCRPTCEEPAEIAVLDHRPAPDCSLCPACRAENNRLLAAIPAALRAKAARYAALEEDQRERDGRPTDED